MKKKSLMVAGFIHNGRLTCIKKKIGIFSSYKTTKSEGYNTYFFALLSGERVIDLPLAIICELGVFGRKNRFVEPSYSIFALFDMCSILDTTTIELREAVVRLLLLSGCFCLHELATAGFLLLKKAVDLFPGQILVGGHDKVDEAATEKRRTFFLK